MTRYLISFSDGAMTFPPEDLPAVDKATHAVVQEAMDAGVWVTGGGLGTREASVVDTDGTLTSGVTPISTEHLGGFSVIQVSSYDEATRWAARFAESCRCAQEVRELMFDPMLDGQAGPVG